MLKLVVHKYLCSSSSVFRLQGIRKMEKNKQYFIEQTLQNPVVMRTTRIAFLVVHIYFLVVINMRTRNFPSLPIP